MFKQASAIDPSAVFSKSRIIPVVVVHHRKVVLPLAEALLEGGMGIIEITLRTSEAMAAIENCRLHCPEMLVGAGTVVASDKLQHVIQAGAQFAFSPGITKELLASAQNVEIPFIPGIATPSELMLGMSFHFNHFKFFPAQIAGGIQLMRSLLSLFPEVRFCPTGGIDASNYMDYLKLPNVACVGGSWLVPQSLIEAEDWKGIAKLCRMAQVSL